MNEKIYLTHWGVIEMFVKLASKFDGTFNQVDSEINEKLPNYIEKYLESTKRASGRLAEKFWERNSDHTEENKKGEKKSKNESIPHSTLMYHLAHLIKSGESFRIPQSTLRDVELVIGKLLNKPTTISLSEDYSFILSLANTKWYAYYFDFKRDTKTKNKAKIITGVVRGLFKIENFGFCFLKAYSARADLTREFTGNVEHDNKLFLVFRLRTELKNQGELIIRIYSGTEKTFSLGLGLFHTYREKIYTKTIMLERAPDDIDPKKFESQFYSHQEKKKHKVIPSHVWKYFEDQERNYLSVPMEVDSLSSLLRWFDKQEKHDYKNETPAVGLKKKNVLKKETKKKLN